LVQIVAAPHADRNIVVPKATLPPVTHWLAKTPSWEQLASLLFHFATITKAGKFPFF
jgi:hypothetical protein